jgi:hypothetical protein
LADIATTQDVAAEIVRSLLGGIGLVASEPITSTLAASSPRVGNAVDACCFVTFEDENVRARP